MINIMEANKTDEPPESSHNHCMVSKFQLMSQILEVMGKCKLVKIRTMMSIITAGMVMPMASNNTSPTIRIFNMAKNVPGIEM